ncbi:MAG: TolC family protein [Luteibacter sp.]
MFSLRAAPWGAVCVLFAASASASTAPLALKAALRDLWTHSPQVQVADAELRAAQARARAAAQPVYNPSIQLEGENADVDRRTAGASLALDLSGKRNARMAQSDAEVRATEAAYALGRRDVASQWLKAWVGVVLAREQSALGQRRVTLMQRFDTLAAQRLKVGDIGSPERDLAALALGEAQIQQASLSGQQADAEAALAMIDGEASRDLPDLPTGPPPDPDAFSAAPTPSRPELLRAQAEQDRADAGVAVARRAQRPDPTITLTGGSVRSGARTDRVIGISVSMPIPIRNTGRADIEAAQADADAAFASRRVALLRADASLAQASATYTALRSATAALQQGRAGAFDERARLLEKLWQAGEIGTSDYLMQLKQSLDTALAAVALKSQAWQAWFDYLTAAGRLVDWIENPSTEATP